jgi:hypothetical protein
MLLKLKDINKELKLDINNELLKHLRNYFYEFIQSISLYKSLDKLNEIASFLLSLDKLVLMKSNQYGLEDVEKADIIISPAYHKYSDIVLDHTFRINSLQKKEKEKEKEKRKRRRMTVRIFDGSSLHKEEYLRSLKANLIHHIDAL